MEYKLKSPCSDCPFRHDIRPYLNYGRVMEIGNNLNRGEFPCHKTTVDGEDGEREESDTSQHCAGALILMEKSERPSQMMRICERLGFYNHKELDMDAPVFDSFEEMAEAQER